MSGVDLSVIIVNYNVKFFLEQTLLSVRSASRALRVEVFVVDNQSTDGSNEMLAEKFPEVHKILNPSNVGFAKANNQAIRQAHGKYILLLNPDTVVAEDTFDRCFAFMEAHPDGGGLGVKMIDGSGVFLPESKRGFPGPFVAFCKTFGLSALFPKSAFFNRYYLGHLDPEKTHRIEVLSGAFMWLRKEALDKSGLLDEDFFMYGEDIDLSYRLTLAGYQNYYFPGTSIIHYKGESTKKGSLNYVRVFYQAMIIFANKHFRGKEAGLFTAMLRLAIYFRAALTLLGNFFREGKPALADTALIYGGLVGLKAFWAVYRFGDPNYYSTDFYLVNAPLYTGIWLFSAWLNGAYESGADFSTLRRGLLLGTLLIAAVYGFLDVEYRTSRALILMGTVWAMAATVSWRYLLHFLRFGNFSPDQPEPLQLLIVGSPGESERARELLQQARVQKNVVGVIDPEGRSLEEGSLGHLNQLYELVRLFGIEEVVFCSGDVTNRQIIAYMNLLGPDISYKILPEGCQSIIGSNYKNTRGELYTVEMAFRINQPVYRRQKRLLDVLLSLLCLPFLPLLALRGQKVGKMLRNALSVLGGKKSWVGYAGDGSFSRNLPPLKPGVLSPADFPDVSELEPRTLEQLNFLYARDYKPSRDWEIFRRGLGR